MPNKIDFSKFSSRKTLIVNPEGWVGPLTIEYAYGVHDDLVSCHWRVKGTKHTFVIPIIRIDYLSQGDYGKHFTEALENFREDYIGWKEEKFYAPWMQEYRDEYERFINT
jgi:hypothetical protein